MMISANQTINFLFGEGILYLLIILVVLGKADFLKRGVGALILYITLSGLGLLAEIFGQMGQIPVLNNNPAVLARIPFYAVFLASPVFLYLNRSFLRRSETDWRWGVIWSLGAFVSAVLIVIEGNFLSLPKLMWVGTVWEMNQAQFIQSLLLVGWGIFMGVAATLTSIAYHQARQQPLHKNRIQYWIPALGFIMGGDIVLFAGNTALGVDLHLLGTLIATYAVMTHRLPDVRQTTRRLVSFLLITFLRVGIYTTILIAVQYLFQTVAGYNPWLAWTVVALILVLISEPMLKLAQSVVNWLIFGSGYDSSQTLSEYGLSISNILDLELLAAVALEIIHKTLGSQRGMLFVVRQTVGQNEENIFNLQGVKWLNEVVPPPVELSDSSPVTHFLQYEHKPLTQYDVDLLSQFQNVSEIERAWLSTLNMDVYVPIYAKNMWIGLLALGPKESGDRYFEADLTLLNTLADQTAVALENARLVEDLKNLNNNLKQTYGDLDQANRRMQELDKLKSAFIGVVTHELRTPFANTIFALEILERYGRQHISTELQEQLDQVGQGVRTSKRMVDNLVTFATFLSKQGELAPVKIDFKDLIRESLYPLKSLAEVVGIKFYLQIPKEFPLLYGDKERLMDAVYHLVHNAIKFTGEGGKVWVRCKVVDEMLHFEVRDTGVGVPEDKLPMLWEGFTQMADPLLRGVEGLGLGLALVKYIVNAHNGEVWARVDEGVGSTFGFSIPLNNSQNVADDTQIVVPQDEEISSIEEPLSVSIPATVELPVKTPV